MKNNISIIFLLISFLNYGQSKSETEDWIKEKIFSYSYKSADISHSYVIDFNSGTMLIRNTSISVVGSFKQEIYCDYWIPIKEISSFRFEENQNNIHFKFLKKNNAKIKSEWLKDKDYKYSDNFYFILDKSFKNDDMFNRMTKAINNLIKLNGGTIKKETF